MTFKAGLPAAFLALLWGAGAAHAQQLSVQSVTGSPGQTVMVDIDTSAQVHNVSALGFIVDFGSSTPAGAPGLTTDPASVSAGSFMKTPLVEGNLLTATRLKVGMVATRNASGAATALTVPFQIPANAADGTTYAIRLSEIQANDQATHDVSLTGADGAVTVHVPNATTGGTTGGKNLPAVQLTAGTGAPGGTATVTIAATDALRNVASILIRLEFDASLTVTDNDVVFGGLIKGLPTVNSMVPGHLVIAAVATSGHNGPGTFAQVSFHIPSNAAAGAVFPVHVSELQAVDAAAKTIAANAGDGSVTVAAGNTTGSLPKIDGGMIQVKSLKVRAGGVASVEITINDKIVNLLGAGFQLVFNSRTPATAPDLKLKGEDASNGNVFKKPLVTVGTSNPGIAEVGIVSGSAGKGPGTLIVVPFQVDKQAPKNTVYALELQNVDLGVGGTDMTADANGGTITVTGRKQGDLNGDDQVSISDATLALQAALNLIQLDADQLAAGDLKGEGKISISDVTLILKVALGLGTFGG